jgi:hypothetical protein
MAHTIAEYRARPHTRTICLEQTVPETMAAYQVWHAHDPEDRQPDELAIEFYMKNTAVARMMQDLDKNQPLSTGHEWLWDSYYDCMSAIGLRAFYYLIFICTRETRHASLTPEMKQLLIPYGAVNFWQQHIKGSSSSTAPAFLQKHAPNISLLNYCEHMLIIFEKGNWGSAYGGPKWANVTRPLRDFAAGSITMEMLLDTVWTLAHNGGPIFNKGILFDMYTPELIKILDVQRAGLIPNLVKFGGVHKITKAHKKWVDQACEILPNFADHPVDWSTVKKLGAVGSHPKTHASITPPKKKSAALTPKLVDPVHQFAVMPNVYVKKTKRAEIKA